MQAFFSLIVYADCVGMTGRVKEIAKLEKTSLSEFTLCRQSVLSEMLRWVWGVVCRNSLPI